MTPFLSIPLLSALCATLIAQLLKIIIVLITERTLDLTRLLETGGMPSSHAAGVAALSTSLALEYGTGHPYFAIAAVFSMIVIYDAAGVRRAAGRHAEILNDLVKTLSHLFEQENHPGVLKTLLGHTYPQVFFGILLGGTVAGVFHYLGAG